MADYQTSLRTNYFHVIDEELFAEFMNSVIVDGDEIELLMHTDADGLPVFGFATHGLIIGTPCDASECIDPDEPMDDGDMYDAFLLGLQELVDNEDAIIILEIGNKKLDDVYASATIITMDDTEYIDLQQLASDKAIDLLNGFGRIAISK